MKSHFLLATAALSFAACNNSPKVVSSESPKNTDLVQQHLQGKVQSFTETSYVVDSTGNTGKMDSVINVNELDNKGYINKFYQKDSTGKVLLEQNFSHYDNGLLKELTSVKNGKPDFKLIADVEGDHFTGAKTFDSTGKQDTYYKDLKSNEYGVVYAGKRYNMNGKFKESWDQKMDKANYLGGTYMDSTGKPSFENTAKVNEQGYMVEEIATTHQKDTTKTERKTYNYTSPDDKGNWTVQTTYNDKGKPTKIVKRTYTYYKD